MYTIRTKDPYLFWVEGGLVYRDKHLCYNEVQCSGTGRVGRSSLYLSQTKIHRQQTTVEKNLDPPVLLLSLFLKYSPYVKESLQ